MTKQLLLAVMALSTAATTTRADVILDWNNTLLESIRTAATNPPMASRHMAMVHTAIYDAINSIDNTHRAYHLNISVPGTTSREAAAAQAARDVLAAIYPAHVATFDTVLTTHLNAIPNSLDKTVGISLGRSVALSMITLRSRDHSTDIVLYSPSGLIGRWSPTLPTNAAALLPNWPFVTPWAMTSGSQFRNQVGPPALDSTTYVDAYNEVLDLGSATSATRTADQTDIAWFWADDSGTSTPPGHWNRIVQTVAVQQVNSLSENARLFALLNIALADAAIVSWDNKYYTDFWRPITGIRQGDTDGVAGTIGDPAWVPLIRTPSFPSYTSGHSTFSGAAAEVLAHFYGTDNISFTTSAEGFAAPDRSFTSFSQAAGEAAKSRLYGGLHWQFDNEDGMTAGMALGNFVYNTQLQAVPEPGTLVMAGFGAIGMLGLHAFLRRTPRS